MTGQTEVYPKVVILGLFFKTFIAEFMHSGSKCLVHFKEDFCTSYGSMHLPTFLSPGM